MSVTWGRILVGIAVAMCLLGVGALEVLSERGESRVFPEPSRIGEVRPEPWGEFGRVDPALTADADVSTPAASQGMTGAVQHRRLTILEANGRARHPIPLPGAACVFTEDGGAGSLALLKPGDVVRIEPMSGRTQRIVVLRHGWQELES